MPADLYIVIKADEVTPTLSSLADSEKDLVYIKVKSGNRVAAVAELANIDDSNWMSSDTIAQGQGHSATDIRVPKKYITG